MAYDLEIEKQLKPRNFEPICIECEDKQADDEEQMFCTGCGYKLFK